MKLLLNLNLIDKDFTLLIMLNILYQNRWKLNWKHHINEVSTKLIRVNAILFKIRNYVKPEILRPIYFGIFESPLNYSSIVWAQNPGPIKRLIILQKKIP